MNLIKEDKLIRKFESDLKNFISFIGDDIGVVPNNCILDLFLVYKDLNDNNYVVNDRESFFVDYFKAHANIFDRSHHLHLQQRS